MTEQFINACLAELDTKLDRDGLDIVRRALSLVASEYDISEKQTAIVPYTGYLPSFYKDYFVIKKIEGKSDKTLKLYHLYLSMFFATVNCDINMITPNMIRAYLYKVQQERNVSNRTLDSRRSVISSFFSWVTSEGYISSNPCAAIKPIKYSSKPRVKLSGVEMEKIRDACTTLRDKAMIEMFYSTGCRVSELVGLNREDIDLSRKEVILYGKGGKYRVSYITPRAEVALVKYLESRADNREALFVG